MRHIGLFIGCALAVAGCGGGERGGGTGGGGGPEGGSGEGPGPDEGGGEGAGDVPGGDGAEGEGGGAGTPDGGGEGEGEGDGGGGEGEGEGEGGAGGAAALADARWIYATMGDQDPLFEALERGEYEPPASSGHDALNVAWDDLAVGAGGTLGAFPPSIVYVATRFTLPDAGPHGIVARPDRVVDLWINGRRLPGDIYGSGRTRVPLLGKPGDNWIVGRALGGRGDVVLSLEATAARVVFNVHDLTFPDPRVGRNDPAPLGVAVLNMGAEALVGVWARVVQDDRWEVTSRLWPALPAGAAVQVGFDLHPRRPPAAAGEAVPVTLRLEGPGLDRAYEQTVTLTAVAADVPYRQTYWSPVDGSVQYYGVHPPAGEEDDPAGLRSLILSLHGAGVDAIGQAAAYSQKDWAYLVAPTNRRPFGFDWEEWGHFEGIATLDHASATLPIDPTRVYVTGHSMGGHGTWQFGVHHPGRFAVAAPSAGWASFYSYTGAQRPGGAFARARAQSDTMVYVRNLANRGVYVLHGDADDNVPVREGRDNAAAARRHGDDVVYHEEPGAGHWWDNDPARPGADCVDWPPLMEFMQAHTLDPFELEFRFRSPYPSYTATHSYVTIRSARTPYEDVEVRSERGQGNDAGTVYLETDNVRSMVLDGAALAAQGVDLVLADDDAIDVVEGDLPVGEQAGKRPDLYGPFNQIFHRPHCYVYPDGEGGRAWSDVAAYWATTWQIIGNGHACAMPAAAVTDKVREDWNLVHLGRSPAAMGDTLLPMDWAGDAITHRGVRYTDAALLFVQPVRGARGARGDAGERLMAGLVAPAGDEYLLLRAVPFSSRSGFPDYLLFDRNGVLATGFFSADWRYERGLGQGPAN